MTAALSKNAQEFKELLPSLITEIENQTNRILKDEVLQINNLKIYLTQLLKLCFINPEPYDSDLLIQVLDTPKNLFKGIIDTEPRIVAFMDILGFKDIIDEYDSDQYSNILKELHDALELAIESSIEKMIDPKTKTDISKYLEYRMFSDCICISMPYIEFGNDFHIQFHSLSVILRSYQFLMMQKGFYIRGGISMGSFFADKNMIFSGGLVNAYKLEQSAIYPIIVIDNKILIRLKNNFKEFTKNLFFAETVLISKETEKIFLNPFEFLDNPAKYIDFMQQTFKDLTKPNSDESDEFSGLIGSLMKLTESLVQPAFDYAKSQLTEENLNSAKQSLIDQIDEKIHNLNTRKDSLNLESEEKTEVSRIISKYEFIKNLIAWAIDKETSDLFEEYKFE